MEEYTLNCLVPGAKDTFSVKIKKDQSVGHLKHAIKSRKPIDFKDVNADHLTLHLIKVDVSDEEEYESIIFEVSQPGYVFDPKRTLIPTSKISRYFGQGPEGDIHILVELPQSRSIDP